MLGVAFYNIIIYPLFAIFEAIYRLVTNNLSLSIGLTIFIISLLVNCLSLPLYINAEKLSEEERKIQEKLAPRIKSIKRNFKGDERFMLLQTYYRQNNYHPIMALRLSLSLLLTIPFFTAAYLFFHNLPLDGVSCLFIKDLSKPDELFHIGKFAINILPILMTVFNVLAVNI